MLLKSGGAPGGAILRWLEPTRKTDSSGLPTGFDEQRHLLRERRRLPWKSAERLAYETLMPFGRAFLEAHCVAKKQRNPWGVRRLALLQRDCTMTLSCLL
jgi:hypothetical protein